MVGGCGGGGSGSGSMPTPKNAAPTITAIASQTINQDTPAGPLAFTVNDDGGAGIIVVASSSNASLIPPSGLALGGTGSARTITVTPAEDATGSATVTVSATDSGGQSSSAMFTVTVNAVTKSVASYTNTTFGQMENDTPVQVSGFTFLQDADDTTFAPLLQ